jgi:hypothetical protein
VYSFSQATLSDKKPNNYKYYEYDADSYLGTYHGMVHT